MDRLWDVLKSRVEDGSKPSLHKKLLDGRNGNTDGLARPLQEVIGARTNTLPRGKQLATEGETESSRRRFSSKDFSQQDHLRMDIEHEGKSRQDEGPRRRRIRSSRASTGPKASSLSAQKSSDIPDYKHSSPSATAACSTIHPSSSVQEFEASSMSQHSLTTPQTQGHFHLKPDPSLRILKEACQEHRPKDVEEDFVTKNKDIFATSVCVNKSLRQLRKTSQFRKGAKTDEPRRRRERSRNQESEIPVHLDDNNDGYYCCGCGIRRSEEHHRIRNFRLGDPVWSNFCHSCHDKHLASDHKTLKAHGNFCFNCGFARSSRFNKDHPIKCGQKPVKNLCVYCRKRVFRKAVVPTETLLGYSSDESDSILDGDSDELLRAQRTDDSGPPQNADDADKALPISDSSCSYDFQRVDEGLVDPSPSESVQDRLHKRRSARQNMEFPEDASLPGCSISPTGGDETREAGISYQVPTVEDAIDTQVRMKNHEQGSFGDHVSPDTQSSALVTQVLCQPVTPKAQTTMKDSGIELGSSLSLDSSWSCKRATFNEEVEVRTSPTYWQREHSDSDDSYKGFRHEQYHEALRDGRKAVPLENPLRDPDGFSARPLRFPCYNPDAGSFSSWSMPDVAYDAFTGCETGSSGAPFVGTFGAQSSRFHPSSLYTPEGYQHSSQAQAHGNVYSESSSSYHGRDEHLDKERPDPNNSQPQPCSVNGRGRWNEKQPCPTNYATFDDVRSSRHHYDIRGSFEEPRATNSFFSNNCYNDDSFVEQTETPRYAQTPYTGEQHFSPFNNYPKVNHSGYHSGPQVSTGASFANSEQGRFSDSQGFYQPDEDLGYAQQHSQSHSVNNNWDQCQASSTGNQNRCYDSGQHSFSWAPSHSKDQPPQGMHGTTHDTELPFESFSATGDTQLGIREPKLPPVGFAMEIPDDMSESEVQTMLIPGYDDYVPWREVASSV